MRIKYKIVLDEIVRQVNEAETKDEKMKLATKFFCKKQLSESSLEAIKENKAAVINIKPERKQDTINGLALAIALADVDATVTLLKALDQKSLNDPSTYVSGYRQPYSPMHVVLDPRGNLNALGEIEDKDSVTIQNNLIAILKCLAEKGARLDEADTLGAYKNPPMAAGEPRGWGVLPQTITTPLRVELLLAGANLNVQGSSFSSNANSSFPRAEILKQLISTFSLADEQKKDHLIKTMHPSTKEDMATTFRDNLDVNKVNLDSRSRLGLFQ